jgi:hypothetical protein
VSVPAAGVSSAAAAFFIARSSLRRAFTLSLAFASAWSLTFNWSSSAGKSDVMKLLELDMAAVAAEAVVVRSI